jgi:hypothetical protein
MEDASIPETGVVMTLVLEPETIPAALQGWLGAHTAFRRDAAALVAAAGALEPRDYVGAGRLACAFAITRRMLHEHHESEDELVFPEMIDRAPEFAGVVMRLSLEHVDLDAVIEDITRDLSILTVSTSGAEAVHARLVQHVGAFQSLIEAHLDEEEEHALPIFLRCFSVAEIDAMGDAHHARNADKLHEMVPWAASAQPADVAAAMIAAQPADVRENFDRWSAAFGRAYAPMLSAQFHQAAA